MNGAVAAGHPLSAEAGARVLAAGGNAIDACVASALVASVVEGPLTGATAGGFLLYLEAGSRPVVYDGFFAAPSQPLGEMEETIIDFADASTQSFHVGIGSVAVPGLLRTLELAQGIHGRLSWPELVEPALELARTGTSVSEAQEFLHEILAAILLREEAGRRIYGAKGRLDTTDLVPTLELIRDRGAAALAAILPEFADDLERYEVTTRDPLQVRFADADVLACPSPSRGGEVVTGGLAHLEAGGLGGLPGSGEAAVRLAEALAAGYGELPAATRPTGTTHISVVDGELNAAALSSTLGSGSGVFRGGSQLNNMLGEFDVIGREPLAPGSRLPSMMTPTIVLQKGRPRLVLGSAGSVRLAGAIMQVVVGVVGHGLTVEEAIERPRLHPEQARLHLEGGFGETAAAALEADGWELVRWGGRNLYFGGVAAVELLSGGRLAAAGDPRRGGSGAVVD